MPYEVIEDPGLPPDEPIPPDVLDEIADDAEEAISEQAEQVSEQYTAQQKEIDAAIKEAIKQARKENRERLPDWGEVAPGELLAFGAYAYDYMLETGDSLLPNYIDLNTSDSLWNALVNEPLIMEAVLSGGRSFEEAMDLLFAEDVTASPDEETDLYDLFSWRIDKQNIPPVRGRTSYGGYRAPVADVSSEWEYVPWQPGMGSHWDYILNPQYIRGQDQWDRAFIWASQHDSVTDYLKQYHNPHQENAWQSLGIALAVPAGWFENAFVTSDWSQAIRANPTDAAIKGGLAGGIAIGLLAGAPIVGTAAAIGYLAQIAYEGATGMENDHSASSFLQASLAESDASDIIEAVVFSVATGGLWKGAGVFEEGAELGLRHMMNSRAAATLWGSIVGSISEPVTKVIHNLGTGQYLFEDIPLDLSERLEDAFWGGLSSKLGYEASSAIDNWDYPGKHLGLQAAAYFLIGELIANAQLVEDVIIDDSSESSIMPTWGGIGNLSSLAGNPFGYLGQRVVLDLGVTELKEAYDWLADILDELAE